MENQLYFFISYSHEDSDFATQLANNLKEKKIDVWIEPFDKNTKDFWGQAKEKALEECNSVLVILSSFSMEDQSVMDDIGFALEEKKSIIPIVYLPCKIPLRLRRFQHIDFNQSYEKGFESLLSLLNVGKLSQLEKAKVVDTKNPEKIEEKTIVDQNLNQPDKPNALLDQHDDSKKVKEENKDNDDSNSKPIQKKKTLDPSSKQGLDSPSKNFTEIENSYSSDVTTNSKLRGLFSIWGKKVYLLSLALYFFSYFLKVARNDDNSSTLYGYDAAWIVFEAIFSSDIIYGFLLSLPNIFAVFILCIFCLKIDIKNWMLFIPIIGVLSMAYWIIPIPNKKWDVGIPKIGYWIWVLGNILMYTSFTFSKWLNVPLFSKK